MKKDDILNNLYPIIFALNNMSSVENVGPNEESLNEIRKSLEKFYLDVQSIEVKRKEPIVLKNFHISRARLIECSRFDYINYIKGETNYLIKQIGNFRFEVGRQNFLKFIFYECETGTMFMSDAILTNRSEIGGHVNINVCNIDNPTQKALMTEFITTNFQGRAFGTYFDHTSEFVFDDESEMEFDVEEILEQISEPF